MKRKIAVWLLAGGFIASCATPGQYDLDKGAPSIPPGKGLLIGKVQRVNANNEPEKWVPTAMMLAGVQFQIMTVVNGQSNTYGIDRNGYYAILADAGDLKQAKIEVKYIAKTIAVTVTDGNAIELATEAKPVRVEAGKVKLLPVQIVKYESIWTAQVAKEIKPDSDEKKGQEVIDWFKDRFPSLAGAQIVR